MDTARHDFNNAAAGITGPTSIAWLSAVFGEPPGTVAPARAAARWRRSRGGPGAGIVGRRSG